MYDINSMKAEEFIDHDEIIETLDFADKNKNNRELIEQILDKAAPKKTGRGVECAGLSHREASVLLACDDPEIVDKDDIEGLQDVIVAGVNAIIQKIDEESAKEMEKVTGGVSFPGLF